MGDFEPHVHLVHVGPRGSLRVTETYRLNIGGRELMPPHRERCFNLEAGRAIRIWSYGARAEIGWLGKASFAGFGTLHRRFGDPPPLEQKEAMK